MLSLRLVQSPALLQRQKLESLLEQSIIVVQGLRQVLAQYQNRENICTKLYQRALKVGQVYQYNKHGLNFEFALVAKKDVPDWIYNRTGHAFSHCLLKGWDILLGGERYARSKGSWLLFVIKDMYPAMPSWAINYAAVHERGEMVTLGDHTLASKLEFAIAAVEKKLTKYMSWIETNCPAKFADVFSYQVHLALPRIDELEELLDVFLESEEAAITKKLIKNFDWPVSVLQRLHQYKEANDKIIEIFNQALSQAEIYIIGASDSIPNIVAGLRSLIEGQLREVKNAQPDKFASPVRLEETWQAGLLRVSETFAQLLFHKQKVMEGVSYIEELKEAGVTGGLPQDGILSLKVADVLKFIAR